MVQWLRLCVPTAAGLGSVLGQGTKVPNAMWLGQKLKLKKNKCKISILEYSRLIMGDDTVGGTYLKVNLVLIKMECGCQKC